MLKMKRLILFVFLLMCLQSTGQELQGSYYAQIIENDGSEMEIYLDLEKNGQFYYFTSNNFIACSTGNWTKKGKYLNFSGIKPCRFYGDTIPIYIVLSNKDTVPKINFINFYKYSRELHLIVNNIDTLIIPKEAKDTSFFYSDLIKTLTIKKEDGQYFNYQVKELDKQQIQIISSPKSIVYHFASLVPQQYLIIKKKDTLIGEISNKKVYFKRITTPQLVKKFPKGVLVSDNRFESNSN